MDRESDREREINAHYEKMLRDDEIAKKSFGEIRDAGIKTKLETDLRHRLGQWYDQKKELGGPDQEFTLSGKHHPLAEKFRIDVDRIIAGAVDASRRLEREAKLRAQINQRGAERKERERDDGRER